MDDDAKWAEAMKCLDELRCAADEEDELPMDVKEADDKFVTACEVKMADAVLSDADEALMAKFDSALAALDRDETEDIMDAHIGHDLALVVESEVADGDALATADLADAIDSGPLLDRWHHAAQDGVRVLVDRADAMRSTKIESLEHGSNMSLVQFADEFNDGAIRVMLVNWYRAASGYGQVVVISDGRPKFSVASFKVDGQPIYQARYFKSMKVVHPDVGLRMLKCKHKDAPSVPKDILRLREMWELALQSDEEPLAPCYICGKGSSGTRTCPLCLLTSHRTCARSLGDDMAKDIDSFIIVVPGGLSEIPDVFQRSGSSDGHASPFDWCPLCQRAVRG